MPTKKKAQKPADPNSLFTVVEAPAMSPGVDFITRTDKGPFVDTHKTIDFAEWKSGSRVYLAESTVLEMAQALDLFDTPEDVEKKIEAAYKAGYEDALKENLGGSIIRAVEDLGFVVDRLADLGGGVRGVVVDALIEAATGSADEHDGDAEPDAPEAGDAAGQEHGPASEQGRADVPVIAGDELSLSI